MSDTPIPPPPSGMPPGPPPAAPPPPSSGASGGTESPNRTIMLVLSYLWLLALIPFLVEKDDKEVQWHAKHGLVLAAAEFALWIVVLIVSAVLAMVVDFLGCVGALLQMVLWLGILALHIFMIFKAVNGERFKIKGLSEFADRF